MYNKIIKQIALSGVLTGLAILVGFFLRFPLFGGNIYLIGVVVFLIPLFLRIDFAFISVSISVILTDILSGWAGYSWISFIAYGFGTIIISLFNNLKFRFSYLAGVFVAGIWIVITYYLLELIVIDKSLAFADFLATSLQMGIVFPIILILYIPAKHIYNTFLV